MVPPGCAYLSQNDVMLCFCLHGWGNVLTANIQCLPDRPAVNTNTSIQHHSLRDLKTKRACLMYTFLSLINMYWLDIWQYLRQLNDLNTNTATFCILLHLFLCRFPTFLFLTFPSLSPSLSWSVQTWQRVNKFPTGGKLFLWVSPNLSLCFSKG